MHRALALLTAPLLLTACELVPANEVDNPRLFHVQAVQHGPDGRTEYQDFTARFRCLRYLCGEEADSEADRFKWSGEPPPPPPVRDEGCRCAGSYVLEGPGGLALGFYGVDALAPGTHLTSEGGELVIFYRRQPGVGAAHISRLSQLRVAGGHDYTYDVAGGFEGQVGPNRFVSGFFYSVRPEDE